MSSKLPWHLKLASLSWIHSGFCCSKYIEAVGHLPTSPDWSQVQSVVENLLLPGKTVRWDRLEKLEKDLSQVAASAGYLICPRDSRFPKRLLGQQGVPALLSFFGSPVWNKNHCLSVVGARKMQAESRLWMNRELKDMLTVSDCVVLSGGAVGVDQESHRLALKAGRPTVVVLPSGLLNPSPRGLQSLVDIVCQRGGAAISMFPPYGLAQAGNFHRRNRLLTQMSDSLLLIQAARRSGSHMSALMAMELGLDVGVVPGHPAQPGFHANLDMIHDGARVVRQSQDIVAMIS